MNVVQTKWSDLIVRSSSAIVLAPLIFGAIWAGGYWYSVFDILLGVLIAREWTMIVHAGDSRQFLLHCAAALLAATALGPLELVVIAILMVASIALVILNNQPRSLWSFIGIPYVALPVLALSVLRADDALGLQAIVWCVALVWSADIMAYFAGRLIGGPKLAPKLSPKKTWAGMAGAIAGAVIASLICSSVFNLTYWPLAFVAAQFAVLEQGGDIFESALKRHHGVKDSGDLIPGHGGILDRADGLLVVVCFAALLGYLRNPELPTAGLLLW